MLAITATLARPQAWLMRNAPTDGVVVAVTRGDRLETDPGTGVERAAARERRHVETLTSDFTRRSSAPTFRVMPLPSCQV